MKQIGRVEVLVKDTGPVENCINGPQVNAGNVPENV
jgi:hypothetical protein